MNTATAIRQTRSAMPSTQTNLLSTKSIAAKDRLIVPLDVPSNEEALKLVELLGDDVHFYKVGLELLLGGKWIEMVEELGARNKAVMLDVKLFDVPATVREAVRQAVKQHVRFVTVHMSDEAIKAAVEVKNGVKILAVTLLTSVNQIDADEFGFSIPVIDFVLARSRRALAIGCDGVISSGLESAQLRKSLGESFLIVTPGIRPVANVDDQKRTVDVEEAFKNGADYIVVGRPIRNAPDPRAAAADIQRRIATLFSS